MNENEKQSQSQSESQPTVAPPPQTASDNNHPAPASSNATPTGEATTAQQPSQQRHPHRFHRGRHHKHGRRRHHHQPPPPQEQGPRVDVRGIIEIGDKGFGFLRNVAKSFQVSPGDVYVPNDIVRRHNLRPGLEVEGRAAVMKKGGSPQLVEILNLNGQSLESYQQLKKFDDLTVVQPSDRYVLETRPELYTTRVIDLISPIGKGQRGLIVAAPRTGKTTLLHHIADAVLANHPDVHVIVLLTDERPEEATDFRRSIRGGEVIASTNDQTIEEHVRTARIAIERAKRLVEFGKDVFVVLDSLTRLARAFNNYIGSTGRTMTGGLDARAMEQPRRIFASARNTEEAGSLTIMATALIDTGSRMDELIFQEFKGTGNLELVLDRKIAEQRYWPAVDLNASGTRREELLMTPKELESVAKLRRILSDLPPVEAIQKLLTGLSKLKTNKEFLKAIA